VALYAVIPAAVGAAFTHIALNKMPPSYLRDFRTAWNKAITERKISVLPNSSVSLPELPVLTTSDVPTTPDIPVTTENPVTDDNPYRSASEAQPPNGSVA
jgi:hypothetical protein